MLGDGEEEPLKRSRVERAMLISAIFSGGGRRVRYFGAIVNVFSFFLISRVIGHNFSFVDLVFRDRVMVLLILESEDSK